MEQKILWVDYELSPIHRHFYHTKHEWLLNQMKKVQDPAAGSDTLKNSMVLQDPVLYLSKTVAAAQSIQRIFN